MDKLRLSEKIKKDLVTGDDGYKVYWPENFPGALNSWLLRLIADTLDEENKEWDEQLKKELDKSTKV